MSTKRWKLLISNTHVRMDVPRIVGDSILIAAVSLQVGVVSAAKERVAKAEEEVKYRMVRNLTVFG